jgi:hypothetical protein
MATARSGEYRGTAEYDLARDELIRAAGYHGTVTYKEVAAVMGLRGWDEDMNASIGGQVGKAATEISEDEYEQGRPLLSAVLVDTRQRNPRPGFYDLARKLGKLRGGSEDVFWDKEKRRVYREWASPNYS